MKNHHTKSKGDLGVLKAQVDLYEQGWLTCIPNTEHAPFDLVAYKNGVFKRIQVKYRELKSGSLQVSLKTSWSDKKGTHINFYDKNEIDVICIFCPNTNNCYYFDVNDCCVSFNLRVEIPKNNQKAKIRLAEDYRKVP